MASLAELITHGTMRSDDGKTVATQVVQCSYCPKTAVIRLGGGALPPDVARKKFVQRGWDIHKKAACPDCRHKLKAPSAPSAQKVIPMAKPASPVQPAQTTIRSLSQLPRLEVAAPREMSPGDRRKVFRAIDEVWDERAARYDGSVTDNSIAETLNVPRIWVETVRKESFGDAGGNDEIAALLTELGEVEGRVKPLVDEALGLATKFERVVAELGAVRARCEKIEKAVGLRK